HVGTRLVAMQSALFHQIKPKPAESESGPVVSEVRSENHSKPDIGKARSIAVTMLKAEVRDPTDDEVAQNLVGEHCWRNDDRENVEGCAPVRIGHLGQVDEFLDRAAAKLSPNPLVFLCYVVIRRMRRPQNADPPEGFQANLDSSVTPIQSCKELHPQAGDSCQIGETAGPARKQQEPVFGRRQLAGQELAFGLVQLQREGELVPALPR